MATLPNKNALADLSGGYYAYWTDGTTEGRATLSVILGSTDAQAAAASFSSLALATPLANDYVAGINQNLLTTSSPTFAALTLGQQIFDTAAGIESNAAGEMSWDEDAETVMLALNDDIHMHIGQDSLYHAINQTGSDIAKGTAVYATGTVGNSGKITIAPFTADGTYDSKYFMGVTAEAILNGETGFVVHFGKIRKLNTNAFEEGDILYADPSTAGGLTNVRPAAPNNIITVAIVVTKSATVGELFVRPTFIDGFADNEDVTITSVSTNDILAYNGTVWANTDSLTLGGLTVDAAGEALMTVSGGTGGTFVLGGNSDADFATLWMLADAKSPLGTHARGVKLSFYDEVSDSFAITTYTNGSKGVDALAIDRATGAATFLSDLTLASGSITSASGAISFGNETITVGNVLTVSANVADMFRLTRSVTNDWSINLTSGRLDIQDEANAGAVRLSIDSSGNHNFQAGSITTTGTLASGAATVTGNLTLAGAAPFINFVSGSNQIYFSGSNLIYTTSGSHQFVGGLLQALAGASITGTLSATSTSGDILTVSHTTSTGFAGARIENDAASGLRVLAYGSAYAAGTVYNVGAGGTSLSTDGNLGIRSNGTEVAIGVGSTEEVSITDGATSITGTLGTTGDITTTGAGGQNMGWRIDSELFSTIYINADKSAGGTTDPTIRFEINDSEKWRMGVDNSGADSFHLATGTFITNTVQRWTTSGASITGTLGVSGLVTSSTNNTGFAAADSGATGRTVLRINGSDVVQVGGISALMTDVAIMTGGANALTLDSSQNATFAGVINTVNASASAPAYSFTGDPDTGFYRSGVNQIGIASGGSVAYTVSSSAFLPAVGSSPNLGGSSNYWGTFYVTDIISAGDLTLSAGDLTVSKNDELNGALLRLNNTAQSSTWGAGDVIGTVDFYASDTSAAGSKAKIYAAQNEGSSYTYPADVSLYFQTSANNVLATALELDQNQNATFAGDVTLSAGELLMPSGDLKIGTGSGGSFNPFSLDRLATVIDSTAGGKAGFTAYVNEGTNNIRAAMYVDDTTLYSVLNASWSTGGLGWAIQTTGVDRILVQNATTTITNDLTLSAGDLGVGVAPTLGKVHVQQDADTSTGGLTLVDTAVGTTLRAWSAGGNLAQISAQAAGTGTLALNSGGGSVVLGATSTSNNAQFYATKTYSNAGGTDIGAFTSFTQDTATTGELRALNGRATVSHTTGTVSTATASYSIVLTNGAGGTTTNARAGYFNVFNSNASATITNAYGVYIDSFTATGTITNRWGIYQAGASENNYLAGDLRIGTTSATSHGTEVIRAEGSGRLLNLHGSTGGASAFTQYTNGATGTAAGDGFIVGIDGSESALVLNYESTPMEFYTAGTERFRVASDAYALGIGITDPNTWGSTFAAVQMGGGFSMWGRTVDTNGFGAGLTYNAYHNGTNWIRHYADEAAQYVIGGNGQHTWSTAASSTAGSTITWSEKMRLTNDGMLLVGDTANTGMTVGLTINQGSNDDEIISLKSSDISHGYTSQGETDTFFSIKKSSPSAGGVRFTCFAEDAAVDTSFQVTAYGGTSTTDKTSTGVGLIDLYAAEHNGSNAISDVTADGVVLSVRGRIGGSNTALFLVDEDGDYFYNGADGGAFDIYEDAHLVRAFANATSKETVRTAHDDWVQYNEQTLVDIGVLGAPVSEGGLINGAQLQRVHTGAIWQNYMAIHDTREELLARLEETESRLAIAESKLKQLPAA
jgi:hypothetical protein